MIVQEKLTENLFVICVLNELANIIMVSLLILEKGVSTTPGNFCVYDIGLAATIKAGV
jgi:hypothetical protein